ncbi:MAG: nuclear transport factor 2 family protein [Dactylosporangium sp.]|nr:nuclear transport factor 2 family protein [Dactylosporangium sp.]NNJ59776.1 nuclear transport factor 2 family protein [Dactylosporangium sp.]
MRSSDITASVAHRWVEAWTSGDRDRVDAILGDRVTIEHNLGLPVERVVLLDTIQALATALGEAEVLSLTATDSRAALLYDCHVRQPAGGPGDIRLAEFLDLDGERIAGIRRIYDLTAVDRLLPGLHGPAAA